MADFQSKMRDLPVSGKLGLRLSFNGNNVAYLARRSATMNSYALIRKQLSKIPFEERQGPPISSFFVGFHNSILILGHGKTMHK